MAVYVVYMSVWSIEEESGVTRLWAEIALHLISEQGKNKLLFMCSEQGFQLVLPAPLRFVLLCDRSLGIWLEDVTPVSPLPQCLSVQYGIEKPGIFQSA